jgi:hypothetical protein
MICPKCHYQRQATDTAPQWQCPACGVAYVKAASSISSSQGSRIPSAERASSKNQFGKRTPIEIGLNLLLLISVGLLLSTWLLKDRLPKQSDIHKELYNEPIQTPSQAEPFEFSYRGEAYKVTPVANYELWGLVVTHNDISGFTDITHDKNSVDIKDLCVIWGQNLNSNDYRDVKYSSGDFTCYWSYHRYVDFHFDKIANNHLLSDSATVRARIRQAEIGDQIHFKGMLVNYSPVSNPNWVRNTSTTRKDTGNHACEVVFVEDFDILQSADNIGNSLFRLSKWLVLIVLLARLAVLFEIPHFVVRR